MRDIITEIWSTARRNKLRTALTGFAVAWGIFMLIVLLGAGNGLINASMNNNSRFIANSMAIFGGTTSKPYKGLKEGRYVPLKDKDITTTETQFMENIDEVGARVSQPATTISLGENYVSTTLEGVYPNHEQTDKMEMRYGRFINHIDMKEKRKVLVLGDKQAEELTHNVESLVGKYLKVGAFAFRVVGIYKEKQNSSASAYTAYTTLQTVYGKSNQPERIVFTFHGLNTEKDLFVEKVVMPALSINSIMLSIYWAAKVFNLSELCWQIFKYNFIDMENLQVSILKLSMIITIWFLFRWLVHTVLAMLRQHYEATDPTTAASKEVMSKNVIQVFIWGVWLMISLSVFHISVAWLLAISGGLSTGIGFAS